MALFMTWQLWEPPTKQEKSICMTFELTTLAMDLKVTFFSICTHGVRHEAMTSAMNFVPIKIATNWTNFFPTSTNISLTPPT